MFTVHPRKLMWFSKRRVRFHPTTGENLPTQTGAQGTPGLAVMVGKMPTLHLDGRAPGTFHKPRPTVIVAEREGGGFSALPKS